MATNDKLQLIFDIINGKDTLSPALKSSQKESDKLTKSLNQIPKTFSSMAGSVAGFYGAIAGVGAALTAVVGGFSLAKAIEEASAAEDAVNELNSALINTGKFTPQVSKSMQDFASSIQSFTRYSDESVLKTSALIQNLANLDEQGLKQATKSAINLASALRIDLDSAATLVGKAANGNISAFQRYGVEIRKGANDAETFANVLKTLETRFGGTAQREISTFAGSLALAKNQFSDLLETLGETITKNPVVIEAIKSLSVVFLELQKSLIKNGDTIKTLIGDLTRLFVASAAVFSELFGDAIAKIQKIFYTSSALINILRGNIKEFGKDSVELLKILKEDKEGKKNVFQTIADDLQVTLGKLTLLNQKGEIKVKGKVVVDTTSSKKSAQESLEEFKKVFEKGNLFENIKLAFEQKNNFAAYSQEFGKRFTEGVGKNLAALATSFTGGAAGATKLVSSISSLAADAFVPGLGAAVGPIVELLSQGTEQVRETIKGFTEALPTIIENIITNIPVIIEALVVGLVDAMDRLAERVDEIVIAFVNNFAKSAPRIAAALAAQAPFLAQIFAIELVKNIPTLIEAFTTEFLKIPEQFAKELMKQVSGFGKVLGGGSSGGDWLETGLNVVTGGLSGALGFAEGGSIKSVLGGMPGRDSVPAKLMPGELVVDRSTAEDLKTFLNNQKSEAPIVVKTDLKIDNRVLGQILLEINRNNVRVTA